MRCDLHLWWNGSPLISCSSPFKECISEVFLLKESHKTFNVRCRSSMIWIQWSPRKLGAKQCLVITMQTTMRVSNQVSKDFIHRLVCIKDPGFLLLQAITTGFKTCCQWEICTSPKWIKELEENMKIEPRIDRLRRNSSKDKNLGKK